MAIKDLMWLERLTWEEKILHWGKEKPWQTDGRSLRLPRVKEISVGHVLVEEGHIRRMPVLIGRPCFGVPTAFLRHGGQNQFFNKRTGQWTLSRCMRCEVRDACKFVAEERLSYEPGILKAWRDFEHAGGGRAMANPRASTAWRTPWNRLKKLLIECGPLESANDELLNNHYDRLEAEHKQKERDRKARERKKLHAARAAQGKFTPEFLSAMNRQRIYRKGRIAEARKHPDAPVRLRKTPHDGPNFDSHVWLAQELLRASQQNATAYTVAKELHRLDIETGRTVNALRSRVEKSQERLLIMARTRLPGISDPVLPRFDIQEIFKEIAEITPYETETD